MPTYPYPRPCVTADVALIGRDPDGDRVLLIRRGGPPFVGQWALPGGFVDVGDEVGAQGEDLPDAAARELAEETGLRGIPLFQVGAFGTPDRDPRHRTITALYMGLLDSPLPSPQAGDDAAAAQWLPVRAVLDGELELAFDHRELVRAAVAMAAGKQAHRCPAATPTSRLEAGAPSRNAHEAAGSRRSQQRVRDELLRARGNFVGPRELLTRRWRTR